MTNPDIVGKTGGHSFVELDRARRVLIAAGVGDKAMSFSRIGDWLDQARIGADQFDGTVYPFSPYENPFIDPADHVRAAAE